MKLPCIDTDTNKNERSEISSVEANSLDSSFTATPVEVIKIVPVRKVRQSVEDKTLKSTFKAVAKVLDFSHAALT